MNDLTKVKSKNMQILIHEKVINESENNENNESELQLHLLVYIL